MDASKRIGILVLAGLLLIGAGAVLLPRMSKPGPGTDGIAARYPGDGGIETDPAVFFVERFDQGTIASLAARYEDVKNQGDLSFVADVPPGSAASKSLLMTAVGGSRPGPHLYKNLAADGSAQDGTVYVRYYVKYRSPFTQHHNGVWMGGSNPPLNWPNPQAGTRPAGDDRFIVGTEPVESTMRLDNYVYWKDMHGDPNGNFWGNDFLQDADLKAPLDAWMCVETMVKLNAPVTASNGELAFWIDGAKRSHLGPGFPTGSWTWDSFHPGDGRPFPGFQWRTDPALNLNWLWLEHYSDNTPAGEQSAMQLANVVAARSYVGCLAPGALRVVPNDRGSSTPITRPDVNTDPARSLLEKPEQATPSLKGSLRC